MAEQGREPDRLHGWDALRGVAIAFVVIIHAAGPLDPDPYRDHVIGGVARLGVPLFVLLSGALAGLRSTASLRFRSYLTKFVRLHLAYGVLYGLFFLAWLGQVDFTLKWVALRFVGSGWAGQYYFLILIQLYFVAAFLVPSRLWTRGWVVIVCACLVPIALAVCFGVREGSLLASLPAPARTLLGRQWLVWFWLYYFALGAWVGAGMRAGARWTPSTRVTLALVTLAVAIAMFGIPLPGDSADPMEYAYLRPRMYVASTLVALALPGIARIRFGRWLASLGRDSFGIFVLNPAILHVLFAIVGLPQEPVVSLLLAVLTLVVAQPLARGVRARLPWLYA